MSLKKKKEQTFINKLKKKERMYKYPTWRQKEEIKSQEEILQIIRVHYRHNFKPMARMKDFLGTYKLPIIGPISSKTLTNNHRRWNGNWKCATETRHWTQIVLQENFIKISKYKLISPYEEK